MESYSRLNQFVLFAVLIMVFGCDAGVTISNLESTLDEKNALRYNILFNTNDSIDAHINYWPVQDTARRLTTGISKKSESHSFKLIGLLPKTEYKYEILTSDQLTGEFSRSKSGSFQSGELPDSLSQLNLEVDQGDVFPGYILVRKVVAPGSDILLDQSGQIIWYNLRDKKIMRPFNWTTDNSIISLDDTKTIYEFDLFGDPIFQWHIEKNELTSDMHHDILKLTNSDILALTHKFFPLDLSSVGGSANDSIKADGLIRLDNQGNLRWRWDILSVADPQKDESILKTKKDWGHANSVSVSSDGNFLISFRDFNQVWKINASSGQVIWKLGENGDFILDDNDIFLRQHSVYELAENELMIFDNGSKDRKTSRALMLKIDEENRRVIQSKSIFLADSLFSSKQGSVYEIANNKFLFSAAAQKKLLITNSEGDVLWQLNSDLPFYRAYYLESLPLQPDLESH